jgi:hypothetical protein
VSEGANLALREASRESLGPRISHGNQETWIIAERCYEIAQRAEKGKFRQVAWSRLPQGARETWFWNAKVVMAALYELGR